MKLQAWLLIPLVSVSAVAWATPITRAADPPCAASLEVSQTSSPTQKRHLELQTRLDRLLYLRVNRPKDQIRALRNRIRDLEAAIRAEHPRSADAVIAQNRLSSIETLYSYFSGQKEKYDGFHPSWKWRQHQTARNESFGVRFERISLAFLEEHGISVRPHFEGRMRDGVTISPEVSGTYLNRLAYRLKKRWNINLVVSPRSLVHEATDGMYSSTTHDIYVSKDLLRTFDLETTTRHEIVHAYIESFADRGISTPFDAELHALPGKKISSYETSGYDEYEDASEVATYAQEVADGGKALKQALKKGSDKRLLRELIVEKLKTPAEEGYKLTQAIIDGANDALKSIRAGKAITVEMGRVSEGRNPSLGYVDIPVGDRAILTLRLVHPSGQPKAKLEPLVLAKLREIINLDQRVLTLYSQISSNLKKAMEDLSPEALESLAKSSTLPKRMAFSSLPSNSAP